MKRLQLRHQDTIFDSRELALAFIASLSDVNAINHATFGESLYAEPLVVRYHDENGKLQLILAVGKVIPAQDGGEVVDYDYHIIDTAKVSEDIAAALERITNAEGEIDDIQAELENANFEIAKCDHELDANVREEYVLKKASGEILGEHIKIYKDSALADVQLGKRGATGATKTDDGYVLDGTFEGDDDAVLYFIYITEDGAIKVVGIDFEKYVLEAEVGKGLEFDDNHVMNVKIGESDEGFLVVDENGLRTEGLVDAINDAIGTSAAENRVVSKDILVERSASGTNLTIQVDGTTIRKDLLYENGVAVLSSSLSLAEVNPTGATIKSMYALVDKNGNVIGEPIKIYKEGSLIAVKRGRTDDIPDFEHGAVADGPGLGEPALWFIYSTSNGYNIINVKLTDYLTENVFSDGLSTAGNVVSVKKAAGSEDYLQIDSAGVAIVGINDAIRNAAESAVTAAGEGAAAMVSAVSESLASEVERATQAESNIIATIESLSNTFETKDNVDTKIAQASANTISAANNYADGKIAEAVSEIDGVKVVDVVYNADANSPKFVQLRLADGTLTNGFDASDFLVDGVLTSVDFDGENLIFIWNDDANTKITVPITSLSDVYTVSSGSASFLKIEGKEISAVVDKEGGYAKTLATTDFVASGKAEAVASAKDYTDASVLVVSNAIDVLNGGESVPGSVVHTVSDKFSRDLITAGLPVTDVTIEDAREHSLLRVINVNGEDRYFASSRATDMLYIPQSGSPVNLNDYITSLEQRVAALEADNEDLKGRVTALENQTIDETAVKNIIKNYLEGTAKEIKIAENGDKLRVGFADDAIFGDYIASA